MLKQVFKYIQRNIALLFICLWCVLVTIGGVRSIKYREVTDGNLIYLNERLDEQKKIIGYLLLLNGFRIPDTTRVPTKDTLDVQYNDSELMEDHSETRMDFLYVKGLGRLKFGNMDGFSICGGSF